MENLLLNGISHQEGVLFAVPAIIRFTVGPFFLISGFHKLFNPVRRHNLKLTFVADGCYNPALMWAIPLGEFFGGLALTVGFLTVVAAFGLVALCLGACFLDGFKRIPSMVPLDKADAVDDVLYLPEVLYIGMLWVVILIGPGALSLDHLFF